MPIIGDIPIERDDPRDHAKNFSAKRERRAAAIAAAAHINARAWEFGHQRAAHIPTPQPSTPPWSALSDSERESAIHVALHALRGEPASRLHERWCAEKRQMRWKLSDRHDWREKTTPWLCAFADLDPRGRDYFDLLIEVATTLGSELWLKYGRHSADGTKPRIELPERWDVELGTLADPTGKSFARFVRKVVDQISAQVTGFRPPYLELFDSVAELVWQTEQFGAYVVIQKADRRMLWYKITVPNGDWVLAGQAAAILPRAFVDYLQSILLAR